MSSSAKPSIVPGWQVPVGPTYPGLRDAPGNPWGPGSPDDLNIWRNPTPRPVTFDLGISRNGVELFLGGTGIFAVYSTDPSAMIEVAFDVAGNPRHFITCPRSMLGFRFQKLFVWNAVQAGEIIQLEIVNDTPFNPIQVQ